MESLEQHQHLLPAEDPGDHRRSQQAPVSPLQDDAGDLRPGEAHPGAEEGSEGQGGPPEGGPDSTGVSRSQTGRGAVPGPPSPQAGPGGEARSQSPDNNQNIQVNELQESIELLNRKLNEAESAHQVGRQTQLAEFRFADKNISVVFNLVLAKTVFVYRTY